MNEKRVKELNKLISWRKNLYPDKTIVVVMSMDVLTYMMYAHSYMISFDKRGNQFYMGCEIRKSRAEKDYLAIAFLNELEDVYFDICEIKEEEEHG